MRVGSDDNSFLKYFCMQSLKLGCIQLLIEVYSDLLIVYFTFVTCVKEELLNVRLMQMNYVQKHSRDHADSECVICGGRP